MKNLNLASIDGIFDVTALIEFLKNSIASNNDRSLEAVGQLSCFMPYLTASQREKINPQLLDFFKKYINSYKHPESYSIVCYFKNCAPYFSSDQLSDFLSGLKKDDWLIIQLSSYYSVSSWIKSLNDRDNPISGEALGELLDYFARLSTLNVKAKLDDFAWDELVQFLLDNLNTFGDKIIKDKNDSFHQEIYESIINRIFMILQQIVTQVPQKYFAIIVKTLLSQVKKDFSHFKNVWIYQSIPFRDYFSLMNKELQSEFLPEIVDLINTDFDGSILLLLTEHLETISPSLRSTILNKIIEKIDDVHLCYFYRQSLRMDLLDKLVLLVSAPDRQEILDKIIKQSSPTSGFFSRCRNLIVTWGRCALMTPGYWNDFIVFLREASENLRKRERQPAGQAELLHVMACFMHDLSVQDRQNVITTFIQGITSDLLLYGEHPTYISKIIPFLSSDQLNFVTDKLITQLLNGTSNSAYIAPFLKVCRENLSLEKFNEILNILINKLGQSKIESINFDIFQTILAWDNFIPEQYWKILFTKISTIINSTKVSHESANSCYLMHSFRALENSIHVIPLHQILNWSSMMINVLFEKNDAQYSELAYSILLGLAARASYPDRVAIMTHVLSYSNSFEIVKNTQATFFNEKHSFWRERFVMKLLSDINQLNVLESEVSIFGSAVKNIILQYSRSLQR